MTLWVAIWPRSGFKARTHARADHHRVAEKVVLPKGAAAPGAVGQAPQGQSLAE